MKTNKIVYTILLVIIIAALGYSLSRYGFHRSAIETGSHRSKTIQNHQPSAHRNEGHIYSMWEKQRRTETVRFSVFQNPNEDSTSFQTEVTVIPFVITVSSQDGEELISCVYERYSAHDSRFRFLDAIVRKLSVSINHESSMYEQYTTLPYQAEIITRHIINNEINHQFINNIFPAVECSDLDITSSALSTNNNTIFYVKLIDQQSLTELNYQSDWIKVVTSEESTYAKSYTYSEDTYYDYGCSYTGEDYASIDDFKSIIR